MLFPKRYVLSQVMNEDKWDEGRQKEDRFFSRKYEHPFVFDHMDAKLGINTTSSMSPHVMELMNKAAKKPSSPQVGANCSAALSHGDVVLLCDSPFHGVPFFFFAIRDRYFRDVPQGKNVARGKVAFASSNQVNDDGKSFHAMNALDGNENTRSPQSEAPPCSGFGRLRTVKGGLTVGIVRGPPPLTNDSRMIYFSIPWLGVSTASVYPSRILAHAFIR